MKNTASLKSKIDSPKTPGGISKALLTPCRRIGLSRNWRKSGLSPFQSPLSSKEIRQEEEKLEKKTRKRKDVCEEPGNSQDTEKEIEIATPTAEVSTPARHVELPRRKKSKTLLSPLNNTSEDPENISKQTQNKKYNKDTEPPEITTNIVTTPEITVIEPISTPVRQKSKSKNKKKSPISKKVTNKTTESTKEILDYNIETSNNKNEVLGSKTEDTKVERNEVKSPNNLTKECIVVIQKKIFKEELKDKETKEKQPNKTSQTLFDSDSDDIPLCQINKEENNAIEEDDDFEIVKKSSSKKLALTFKLKKTKTEIESKQQNSKVSDEENKTIDIPKKATSTSKPKKTNSKNQNFETENQNCQNSDDDKKLERHKNEIISKPNSKVQKLDIKTQHFQTSHDDDDDFVEQKRTIIIKKTYDKPKLIKAKSTGSITQKDIDELKMRIEKKRKLLLAKAMTEDTKELRELIKKWQKGCQDALMELMDLMKTKMPDKNMHYSEMLKALKIPAHLVGYDSENDNFCTPDDESIILANLGD